MGGFQIFADKNIPTLESTKHSQIATFRILSTYTQETEIVYENVVCRPRFQVFDIYKPHFLRPACLLSNLAVFGIGCLILRRSVYLDVAVGLQPTV